MPKIRNRKIVKPVSAPAPAPAPKKKVVASNKIFNKNAFIKELLADGGATLGAMVGQPILGRVAGAAASRFLGFGDYQVKYNSLIHGDSKQTVSMQNVGKRGVRIVEREYIGDVISSATANQFENKVYVVNPSDSKTFPWLSRMAAMFDQWEPNGIVFEHVPTSADFNGSSQALGAVTLAADYDVEDEPYATLVEMQSSDYCVSSKPSVIINAGLECDPTERPTRLLYTSGESRLSHLAHFQVATSGVSQAGVVLGQLWVSYDITFYKKQLAPPGLPVFQADTFDIGAGANMFSEAVENENTIGVTRDAFNNLIFPPETIGKSYLMIVEAQSDTDGLVLAPSGTTHMTTIVQSTSTNVTVGNAAGVYVLVVKVLPFSSAASGVISFATAVVPAANTASYSISLIEVADGVPWEFY
jgi:hypothetical protein